MPIAVNDLGDEAARLAEPWPVIEPLMAGTRAMRKAGKRLLPQWPREEDDAYQSRLDTATLFPAYRRTVGVMAGKPFAKPLTVGDAPEAVLKQWEPWLSNIDRKGTSLHVFAAEMLSEGVAYGMAGIYVDYPRANSVSRTASGVTTRAAERAAGLRPYFVRVMHDQILGWRFGEDGTLSMLRFRESVQADDGPYGTKSVERVRVLRRGSWEVHQKSGSTWVKVDEGTTPTVTAIPFVPVYGRRLGYMHGVPPLEDLAHLNVKHWQSQSDQDTILHASRVPILAIIGADDETQLTIGASSAVKLPLNADMKFVEHTGASISAGAESLTALEEQMIQTGAELLVKQPGTRTATESASDAEGNKCDLQRIVEDFEDALDQALVIAGQYAGIEAPSVQLYKDFGASTLTDASAQLVADLNARGLLTKETTLREMQRRGVVSDTVDVAEEIEKASAEGPALGMAGEPPVQE